MRYAAKVLAMSLLAVLTPAGFAADKPAQRTAREALKPFNDLIGTWKAIGQPEGKLEDKRKGLWEESINWEWQFKDNDAWLKVTFDKGKYFAAGTLRYLPDKDCYQLALTTAEQQTLVFTGRLKEHRLLLERQDEKTKETQRLVVSLLQDNRYLYHYEVQPENRTLSRKVYVVGATKEGKPLVETSAEIGPFCVVSYGPPLTPITYKGKTYYICCGGCRDEFRREPEKYIQEYEELLAKMAKERAEKNKKQ